MRMSWNIRLAAALLATALVGCGGGGGQGEGPGASGTPKEIIIDGSSTVYRISLAAQEAYYEIKPGITVVVDFHGTGAGFSRYLQGEVDIVDASRVASEGEEAKAKAQAIDWTRFLVGYDGITLVTNPKNTAITSLTVAQLKKIWEPGSKVANWKDVDPSWPDRKLVLYCPDHDSGTFEFFTEAIVGKKNTQRDDVQASSDDTTLVNGVAGDADGLGYFGYAYYAANKDKLRALAVQNGPDAKPVAPSPETVLDKSYAPLSRPLYIYVKNSSIRRPEVSEFLKYYLDHVAELARKGGYVSPTEEDRAANLKALPASGPAGVTASK